MEQIINNAYAQAGAIGILISLAIYIAIKLSKQKDEIITTIYNDLKEDKKLLLHEYQMLNIERKDLQTTLLNITIKNQEILEKSLIIIERITNGDNNSNN